MTPLPPLAPELLARLDDFIMPLLCGLSSRRDRRVAHDYVHGLLGPGERKTVAPIAQRARGVESAPATEAWMRAMLNDSQWSHSAMISEGMIRLWERSEGWAAITLDDTALLKKGTHSVGVHNQYAGCIGGLANCQVLVTLGLAQEHASSPCAAQLFLPEAWDQDQARREECHVPANVHYQPKWQIALGLLRRLSDDGVPKLPVLADSLYGDVTELRTTLQRRDWPYVVGVSNATKVWPLDTCFAVPPSPRGGGRPTRRLRPTQGQKPLLLKELAASLPVDAWQIVTWRHGSRGLQIGRFAAVRVRVSHGWNGTSVDVEDLLAEEWLLIHWPDDEAEPTKAWVSNLPDDVPLISLVAYARLRWRIERDYQEGKGLLGLDHYEGRTWHGLHHHVALIAIAHQFLALERLRAMAEIVPPLDSPRSSGSRREIAPPPPTHRSSPSPLLPVAVVFPP